MEAGRGNLLLLTPSSHVMLTVNNPHRDFPQQGMQNQKPPVHRNPCVSYGSSYKKQCGQQMFEITDFLFAFTVELHIEPRSLAWMWIESVE